MFDFMLHMQADCFDTFGKVAESGLFTCLVDCLV